MFQTLQKEENTIQFLVCMAAPLTHLSPLSISIPPENILIWVSNTKNTKDTFLDTKDTFLEYCNRFLFFIYSEECFWTLPAQLVFIF